MLTFSSTHSSVKRMNEKHLLASRQLISKQVELLEKFYNEGKTIEVHTVEKTWDEVARELGISKQALATHLKTLKELGYVRTGRRFIDLTDRALELLGEKEDDVFILVKVEPTRRREVYEFIKRLRIKRAYRVTGEIDVIIEADNTRLDEILEKLSSLDGVMAMKTHVTIKESRQISEGLSDQNWRT